MDDRGQQLYLMSRHEANFLDLGLTSSKTSIDGSQYYKIKKIQSLSFVSQIHSSTSGKWMTLQSNLWVPFVICYQIVISFSASTSSIRETQTYSHHHHHDLFSFFHYHAEHFLTKDKAKDEKKVTTLD